MGGYSTAAVGVLERQGAAGKGRRIEGSHHSGRVAPDQGGGSPVSQHLDALFHADLGAHRLEGEVHSEAAGDAPHRFHGVLGGRVHHI